MATNSLDGGVVFNGFKTLDGTSLLSIDAMEGGAPISDGGVLPDTGGDGNILYSNNGLWGVIPNRSVNAPTTASYITVNPEAELTSERQLAVDTTQLRITDNGPGSTVSLAFPAAEPPQSTFAPTINNHLTNKAYVDLQVGGAGALPAPGTSGNVMTSDGTSWISSVPSAGMLRAFYAEKNAQQTLGAGPTNVTFQTVINNINSCINVISTTEFDIVNAGYYQIVFNGTFYSTAAINPPEASFRLTINTIQVKWLYMDGTATATATDEIPVCLYWEGNLAANDRIVYIANGNGWQIGGAGVNTAGGFFVRQIGSTLTVNSLAESLILSSFGQSDYITSTLNAKYPNTRHIWYNKLAVAGGNSFFVNNGETLPVIEVTITTKSTMPQWPVYICLFGGAFTSAQDLAWFMLPQPNTTKTYTILSNQPAPGNRTCAAGTYTSLWDNTTTNVIASPTNVQACDGAAGSIWGLTWKIIIGDTTQVIENYDTITSGSFANINLLTNPSASDYFSAIQIRGRY